MALELKQNLRLSQQLVITPQLQQAIKLLQLSRLELLDVIQEELDINPVLEESAPEGSDSSESEVPGLGVSEGSEPAPEEAQFSEIQVSERVREDFDWENYLGDYSAGTPTLVESDDREEFPPLDQRVAERASLEDHLRRQVGLSGMSEREKEIAQAIVGNLTGDGYLDATVAELAGLSGATAPEVEAVLARVQTLDPPGVAARDLRECLLAQARLLDPPDPLLAAIIENHLEALGNRNYAAIVKALKRPAEEVKAAVARILSLNPRPGAAFDEGDTRYVSPDVFVIKVDDEFVVVLNDEGLPRLRVSPYYREALGKGSGVSGETREYIQGKLRAAAWLIKSIHQRQRTLRRVCESIVRFQREFFERGVGHLKPMVLRDVAEDVEMHESTISRVTTSKYMHTPQGIFELKYFFNSSINSIVGEAVASESVKERIRQVVKGEDPASPLSDQEIVDFLGRENVRIARRTVAKYRDMLGILPSHKRKSVSWEV